MAVVTSPVDEFEQIAKLLRPLTDGAPEALDLLDDAAVIPSRPGYDLVISKDAMVEGVHFLPDDPLDLVAGKLLRANLSDLAAKAAEPYAYLLATAWSPRCGWAEREAFAAWLRGDQDLFGLRLIGGDTVATPGPLTLSLTVLGWVPAGRMVRRGGARAGDMLMVSGTIGDGWLGLDAARGGLPGLSAADRDWLADRYRRPQPRLALREALLAHATAAADVSDGLIADAGHIGEASGLAVEIDLDAVPLSEAATKWTAAQPDQAAALTSLATGGDDYEIVCTVAPEDAGAFQAMSQAAGVAMTRIGRVAVGDGVTVLQNEQPLTISRTGYRHR